MVRLTQFWIDVRSSLWFVPALIVVAAAGLALGLIELDQRVPDLAERWPRLFGAGSEGSREMLGVTAGSMITVAGITFSVTIVALSLAANQYTPRILRNFMRDRGNQTVIVVFVGIFTYYLVVLWSVRGGDEDGFVPSVAVLDQHDRERHPDQRDEEAGLVVEEVLARNIDHAGSGAGPV